MSAKPGGVVRKSKHNIAQKLALNHEETRNKIHTKYKLSKSKCQCANQNTQKIQNVHVRSLYQKVGWQHCKQQDFH